MLAEKWECDMKRVKRFLSVAMFFAIVFILFGYPLLFLVSGTIKGNDELNYLLVPMLESADRELKWRLLPQYPTLRHYFRVMIDTPEFWILFWNSVKIVVAVMAGQLLVSVPAAWGFAKYRFRGNKILFRVYIFFMLLPFQAKMLSEYLVLDKITLLDTHWAIILPGIFSTFPVFILYQFFKGIPQEVLESARLDGAGEWIIFTKVGIPLAMNGIAAVFILNFIEYWNIIEQPLVFLKSKNLWPLSMYMPDVLQNNPGDMFVKIVVTSIPLVVLFLSGQEHLKKGIHIMVADEKE